MIFKWKIKQNISKSKNSFKGPYGHTNEKVETICHYKTFKTITVRDIWNIQENNL